MTNTSHLSDTIFSVIGWLFGFLVLAIGLVNTFWGNDPGFGIFILLLALVFLPPVNSFLKEKTGCSVPRVVKWILGLLVLMAALGVGELFDKIDLMLNSF